MSSGETNYLTSLILNAMLDSLSMRSVENQSEYSERGFDFLFADAENAGHV